MAKKIESGFQITFPENLKKDTNISTTEKLSFDDLGDFIDEREKIKRMLDRAGETKLRIDYSNFSNHVFFDSAVQKFGIAQDRILQKYPFNGTLEEKEAFNLTGSDYEEYVLDEWPKYVGYVNLSASNAQFISSSDVDNKLWMSTSSLYVSAWTKPSITDQHMVIQVMSASTGPILKQGYELYFSGASDPHVKFSIYSGSEVVSVSASYSDAVGFNNVAVIYDRPANLLSLYVNESKQASSSVGFGSIEFAPSNLLVGSGSQHTAASSSFGFYSGSLSEIRIAHTASEVLHVKNFSRPIHSEPYWKAHYKFNEGITDIDSVNEIVIDYSKSGLHGKILNYSSSVRKSGSVMSSDPGDPILYSFHSDVVSFSSSVGLSASLHDLRNNNMIFNIIPEGMLLEDEASEGLYRSFTLALARFFDQTKLYIDQFDNLRVTNYDSIDETPDLFLSNLQKYFGWKVTEHFSDSNPLQFFFGENILSSGSLDISLFEIRNQFWRRILNNLPYLLKTKGKRHGLDAFFNVLGINKENIRIKEYGYLPGGSIQDDRIERQKVQSFLGIGTGSLGSNSGSFVKAFPSFSVDATTSDFTVEAMIQLPFVSASYSGSAITGSVWQLDDSQTRAIHLYWIRNSILDESGKFILSGTNSGASAFFSSSELDIFDGEKIHISAGRNISGLPFISLRGIEGCDITLSEDFSGSAAFDMNGTGTYDFIMGAGSGSLSVGDTQGFFGEYRLWNRALSGSELDDHALHFESIGTKDPLEVPNPLIGHWPLNDEIVTNSSTEINGITDLSRNGLTATGSQFPSGENAYQKFLTNYNYLSPSVDLKWTENKVRIRNKTELTIDDVASDTNEMSLEFNFVDSLNEDITKIFSSFDIINDVIGQPVMKYRDEYSDLEGYRRVYFDRLGDSINFTRFFNLFRWFDKKISNSIKQLLPARVKFIGGEQVVESHFLERPRYKFQYPVFRTPQEVPEAIIDFTASFTADLMPVHEAEGSVQSQFVRSIQEDADRYSSISSRPSSVDISGDVFNPNIVSKFSAGSEVVDKISLQTTSGPVFRRIKVSGDTKQDISDSASGVNSRNEFARRVLQKKERDNE